MQIHKRNFGHRERARKKPPPLPVGSTCSENTKDVPLVSLYQGIDSFTGQGSIMVGGVRAKDGRDGCDRRDGRG